MNYYKSPEEGSFLFKTGVRRVAQGTGKELNIPIAVSRIPHAARRMPSFHSSPLTRSQITQHQKKYNSSSKTVMKKKRALL